MRISLSVRDRDGRGDRYSVSLQWVYIFMFLCSSMCIHNCGCRVGHLGSGLSYLLLHLSTIPPSLHGSAYANTCLCVWTRCYVCADDLDSRWVNSQVCPSFGGRIRSRWDSAWLDVSRLMSFPSLTSAATAAAWAKLETGTQSWPAFTRLIYIVPQMYQAIMPCQLRIKFG